MATNTLIQKEEINNFGDLPPQKSLAERFLSVRQQTMLLCKPLQPEDYVVQPVVDVSPPKWHLGHTTWFYEQFVLSEYKKGYKLFHAKYNYLFNSYYESVGERVYRSNRGNLSRPTVQEVYAYREYVDAAMQDFLQNNQPEGKLLEILELGLQHEQQHQELLLTDIKYILGHNPLFPRYAEKSGLQPDIPMHATEIKANFITIPEGIYEIGYQGKGFKFDNEEGAHKVFLHAFQLQDRLITNREYLEFMEAGGYQDFKYWLSEAWEWINVNKVDAPLYWFRIDAQWHQYTLQGLQKIDPDSPITHISYFEADAYANWKNMRLLSEYEWEVACKSLHTDIPDTANFVETEQYTPMPKQQNDLQMLGNVWEWTSSAYLPYPYFTKEEGALGEYNGKFMVNQMVLRGGSCATPRSHIRPTYRNFFHPHLRWQFTGIRLARHI